MMIVRFFSLKLCINNNNNNKYRVPGYSRKIKKYKKLMIVLVFFFSTNTRVVLCTRVDCKFYSYFISDFLSQCCVFLCAPPLA